MSADACLDTLFAEWGGAPAKPDAIVGLLRDAIVRGVLPPGMALRQDPIAQRFGISKIPLREALARLETEGFVVTHPGRGVFVAALRQDQIREIFHLRVLLEVDLLRHAVPRMTAETFAEAADAIEEFETAPTHDLGNVNWRIHSTLYRPAARRLSLEILHGLHLHADRYVQLHMGAMDTSRSSNDEHRALLAACREGRTAIACAVLQDHLEGIGRTICGYAAQLDAQKD